MECVCVCVLEVSILGESGFRILERIGMRESRRAVNQCKVVRRSRECMTDMEVIFVLSSGIALDDDSYLYNTY